MILYHTNILDKNLLLCERRIKDGVLYVKEIVTHSRQFRGEESSG
jgi:hypothetical protein